MSIVHIGIFSKGLSRRPWGTNLTVLEIRGSMVSFIYIMIYIYIDTHIHTLLFLHKIRIKIYTLSCYLPVTTIFNGCLKTIKRRKRACENSEVISK